MARALSVSIGSCALQLPISLPLACTLAGSMAGTVAQSDRVRAAALLGAHCVQNHALPMQLSHHAPHEVFDGCRHRRWLLKGHPGVQRCMCCCVQWTASMQLTGGTCCRSCSKCVVWFLLLSCFFLSHRGDVKGLCDSCLCVRTAQARLPQPLSMDMRRRTFVRTRDIPSKVTAN